MSSSVTQSSLRDFRHGPYFLFRDASDNHVAIPSRKDLEGYLVQDIESDSQAQIRFIRDAEPQASDQLEARWHEFIRFQDSDLFPSVFAVGRYDSLPFCVSELPNGEPINNFFERNGKIPAEVSARLVLDFVESLIAHGESIYQKFAISPQSVWMTRTNAQPKIVLGEIAEIEHESPESHNCQLAIDLLKFLTDESGGHPAVEKLFTLLSENGNNLSEIETTLRQFTTQFPAANYWMGYNEPESVLESVTFSRKYNYEDSRHSQIVENAKKGLWPVLIATSMIVAVFVGYCFYSLHGDPIVAQPKVEKPRPAVVYSEPVPAPVVTNTAKFNKPRPVVRTTTVVTNSTQAPAPRPRPQIITDPTVPIRLNTSVFSDPESPFVKAQKVAAPINAKPTDHLKKLLGNTGDLFKDILTKPTSEWLVHDDIKKPSRQKKEGFTDADAKALIELKKKKASSSAQNNNQTFVAIKHEVELLKLVPDSMDARIRLHDYLTHLEDSSGEKVDLSEAEIEILVEASNENALAKDILKLHFAQTLYPSL